MAFVDIRASHLGVCALTADRRVACKGWGWDARRVAGLPMGLRFRSIDMASVTGVCAVIDAREPWVYEEPPEAWDMPDDGPVSCTPFSGLDERRPAGDWRFLDVRVGMFACATSERDRRVVCWKPPYDEEERDRRTYAPDRLLRTYDVGTGAWACGVDLDGHLVCWSESFVERPPRDSIGRPPGGEFQSVAVGDSHACALDTAGKAACWGLPDSRLSPPDVALKDISATGGHTCGVGVDGTLVCWGDDCSAPWAPPQGRFVRVAAGGCFNCAIDEGGRVVCWGDHEVGDLAEALAP